MMRKHILVFMLGVLLLGNPPAARAQSAAAEIRMFDRAGNETTHVIDGNEISLSVRLAQASGQAAEASFFLDDEKVPVASCALAAASNMCATVTLPALGWYWDAGGISRPKRSIHVRIGQQTLSGELTVDVRPRPVVLVHGFISDWRAWEPYLGESGYLASIGLQGFAVGDGQAPGTMNTGDPTKPSGRTNTIAQNAEVLAGYIAGVKAKTGAGKVDLLVHSMGGMISRFYIDRVMTDHDVAQVVFLGTPMTGSACVYPAVSLGLLLPATAEIQPSYMIQIFNPQITHRHGIPFYMVAGTRLTDPLTSPCAPAPSDAVVSLQSAEAVQLDGLQQVPLIHTELNTSAEVFAQAVRQKLQAPPGSFDPRPDPPIPAGAYQPEQFSRGRGGHLDPGQTAQVTINIDSNVTLASFNLYDSSRSLSIEVQGASGNLIQLDPLKNGELKIDDPQTMLYLGYGFAQPKPGAWVVTLHTTDSTPAQGANYGIDARFEGGAVLEAQSSPTIPQPGQPVLLSARLREGSAPLAIDSALANIQRPDGTSESLDLARGADGYSASYTPTEAGLYAIELDVTGTAPDGARVDRAAHLSLQAEPGQQQVAGSRGIVLAAGLAILAILMVLLLAAVIFGIARGRRQHR